MARFFKKKYDYYYYFKISGPGQKLLYKTPGYVNTESLKAHAH